ncbi:MAG: dihydrodipicolinate synthase family protein [Ruminococcaceae bacterium]|nr:dihydrodipicolinate synthase family protein [Oscillospiraceae bacterium]
MLTEIKGICPIIAAPFTKDGEVDYKSLDNLVKALIKGGCHATTLFGIAGEYYKLTDTEREKMVEVCVNATKEAKGKLIISVTDHSTEVAVKRAKYFEKMGADCLMILPPFFLKPGAKWLYDHMKAIADAVKIPVMAQYAPEQTGVAIPPETFVKLEKECPNMIYYKIECKPAGPYVTNLMTLTGGKMKIFVGNAGFQLIECMDRGAIGAMPGCSMFDVYLDIFNNYVSGNRDDAIKAHDELLPMLNHIRQNVEQIIYFEKKILKRRGIIESDYCRKPSFATDDYFEKLFDEFYDKMAKKYNW